jgi:hypothetical protein
MTNIETFKEVIIPLLTVVVVPLVVFILKEIKNHDKAITMIEGKIEKNEQRLDYIDSTCQLGIKHLSEEFEEMKTEIKTVVQYIYKQQGRDEA